MAHVIVSVDPGSPAERAGIRAGDRLRLINGEVIRDCIDYQAMTAEKNLSLLISRADKAMTFRIRKPEYAPVGLNFAEPLMDCTRMCCNHCLFCFVDQLPDCVRPSMRVKDDDWRLSLMTGSYVTLTNMPDAGINRIIKRHASPLYISVHAADPDLRARILGTPRAAHLMRQLKMLSEGGIEFHCQAVLCPGLNDGEALEDTISRLLPLKGARSLALVPVGLTRHREGLYPLQPYTRDEARAVIAIAERWQEKLLKERGTRFVFPSDEFYLLAELPIPPDEAYEDYDQIDDGVGLLRLLHTEFRYAWEDLPEDMRRKTEDGEDIVIACGVSAAPFLREMLSEFPVARTRIRVIPILNRYFGESVTVSGLVTGGDLIDQLKGIRADRILITQTMLRSEGDAFLDDITPEEARQALGIPIRPVGRSGEALLEALIHP